MSKLLFTLLLALVMGCSVVYSQMDLSGMERAVKVVCGPKLSKENKEIVNTCDKMIPSFVRSGFNSCVKQVLKVNKMTKPAVCYQAGTDGNKLTPCIQRKAKAHAKRMPPGMNIESLTKQLTADYTACMNRIN